MARNFVDVYENIINLLPKKLAKKLEQESPYWAPEALWDGLSLWVNKNVRVDSTDKTSIKIYSELCNVSEEKMEASFKSIGK